MFIQEFSDLQTMYLSAAAMVSPLQGCWAASKNNSDPNCSKATKNGFLDREERGAGYEAPLLDARFLRVTVLNRGMLLKFEWGDSAPWALLDSRICQ